MTLTWPSGTSGQVPPWKVIVSWCVSNPPVTPRFVSFLEKREATLGVRGGGTVPAHGVPVLVSHELSRISAVSELRDGVSVTATPPSEKRSIEDPAYGGAQMLWLDSVVNRLWCTRRINGMADDDMDSPDPPSAKAITALLREARSLSRRADKLGGTAATVDDTTTQQLAAAACTSMEQLVHHLTVLERQLQRHEKAAIRGDP